MTGRVYGAAFYAERRDATRHAARTVLECVRQVRPFGSVVDIGCGTGTWLATARTLGAARLQGFEGTWLQPGWVDDAAIPITRQDLREPLAVGDRFDLAICLEVAEHLPAARAAGFVHELCALADMVLFGAAIPGQGGDGHVNEQWASYWIELFRREGYEPLDVVRPAIWEDPAIPYWYRQNTLLYVRGGVRPERPPPDLVHPAQWQTFRDRWAAPSVREALQAVARAARRVLRRLSGQR